jgi:hypothetical protein
MVGTPYIKIYEINESPNLSKPQALLEYGFPDSLTASL